MIGEVGRPKNNDYPTYMSPDGDRGGFVVRNPITGKKKRFTVAQEALARQTAELLVKWVETRRQKDQLDDGRATVTQVIDRWIIEKLPHMPWDTSTAQTAQLRLERIRAEMGERLMDDTDCVYLDSWLRKTAPKADPFNKWRLILVLLWRFAVAQKLAVSNEAEKVERRSTSRKIAGNRKVRQQLDVGGFEAIHGQAPVWLQLAMELSLVTLQARREVCTIQHAHFREGYLFVIRDKVAADSHMAFIKIRLTGELEALRARALRLDDIASPYLIHRKPERRQRRWMAGKPHWTYVNEGYLTKAFSAARDRLERFQRLPERERPTFHEIRGLGSRLHLAKGIDKSAIQSLMTHSSPRTTAIYLERGAQALTPDDYQTVNAPFSIRELLA